MPKRPLQSIFTLFILALTQGCGSCANTGQRVLGLMPGIINDPSNYSLRRAILNFGLDQFCPEMLSHDAPLKLTEDMPVIGRFYPKTCEKHQLDNGDLSVHFTGIGYAYTNLSKKLTFTMSGTVEYAQDFQLDGSTMYAYFRTKRVSSSDFRTHVIEQPVANFLNSVAPLADTFGRQLVSGKLGEGFTVIRDSNGNTDFSIGMVETGKKPSHPYDVHGGGRLTYENARTEVHQNERDFIGPIEIQDSGRALYLTAGLDGAPALDIMVLRKSEGEASLGYYFDYPQTGPLAGAPYSSDVVQARTEYRRTIPLSPGVYYIVLDNTPTAGSVFPMINLFDDRAAVVSYAAQVGDAP